MKNLEKLSLMRFEQLSPVEEAQLRGDSNGGSGFNKQRRSIR